MTGLTRKQLDALAVGMPYRSESTKEQVRAWLVEYRPRVLAKAEGREVAETWSTATLDLLTVALPRIDQDGVLVSTITITEEQARLSRIRAVFNGGRGVITAGDYTALFVDDVLWMSDTPDEKWDHYEPVANAVHNGGRVLINGLGLGMVVAAMLKLPNVTHVDVVEHDKRIIDAIGPHYAGERCTIHHADAYTIQWPVNTRWSVVWHDIWPVIGADNLPEMHKLHRKYGRRADWQGSWARGICEEMERRGW